MQLWTPIETKEQAEKARRDAVLGLFGLAALQASFGLFFWWDSIHDIQSVDLLAPTLAIAAFIFVVLGIVLYFSPSRIIAGILVLLTGFNLWSWLSTGIASGNFAGSSSLVILAVVTFQVLSSVFRIHEWKKKSGETLGRSKLLLSMMGATSVFTVAAFLIPPIHFRYHTSREITLVENQNNIRYTEPLDKYSFDFPNTWNFKQPPLQYGDVQLHPEGNSEVSVSIERWQPWSIAPDSIFSADAFLKFANDEAAAYSKETDAAIESVEMLPVPTVNEAKVVYLKTDGTRQYDYYVYNRAWSRTTSNAAWFFWRITASVPNKYESYEADVEMIVSSFRVNQ